MVPTTAKRPRRATWRTVVVKLSRKLSITYRIGERARASRLLAVLLGAFAAAPVWALPQGMTVGAGQVTAAPPSPGSMVLNQSTARAVLDWRSFNIGAGESVRFVQPDARSVVLNRVAGGEPSSILGALGANGQVFLVNPAGVLFGAGARVDVGALAASTLGIRNADFMAGRYVFEGAGGSIVNQGVLRAQPGGFVLLAGSNVHNSGLIQADAGGIGLAAGARVALDASGAGLVRFSVEAAAANALVANSGTLQSNGGSVALLASAAGSALATVVNQSGVVRAQTAVERDGLIILSGGTNGIVRAGGVLDARGDQSGLAGGRIEVLGDKVAVLPDARIDASGRAGGGTVLVGGGWQGGVASAPNANRSIVAAGAVLRADATESGNGGKVVVWAEGDTRFSGQISARGGPLGGNGGQVEVSGRQDLGFHGKVDVNAPLGLGGKVVLDPQDIVIDNSTQAAPTDNGTGVADVGFADPPDPGTYTVQVADVTGFSELYLQATNNITLSAPFTMGAGNSVKFEANNNIAINSALAVSGGGTVTLTADADNSGAGTLTVAAAIASGGGAISLGGAAYVQNANIDVNAGAGALTVAADAIAIAANTGNNALTTSGTLALKPKTASQAMSLAGAAGFDLSAAEITAILTGATGPIVVGDAASSGAMTIGGAATFTGKNLTLHAGTISDTGTQTVTATSVSLNANGQIGADATNGIDVAATNLRVNTTGNANAYVRSGAISLGSGTSSVGSGTLDLRATGAVTQSGAITAGTLNVKTVGTNLAATLTNSANDVATVSLQSRNATDLANSGGALQYTDANAVDIALAGSTGNVTLVAGGAITQTGAIAAATFTATTANPAGAAITLTNAGNAVTTLNLQARTGTAAAVGTANAPGAISYTESNGVAVSGINTGTGAGGAVTLLAGGAITQSGGIKATTLGVTTASAGGSAITLANAANDVTTVNLQVRDGTVGAVGANNAVVAISYRDTNGFDISGINNGAGAAGAVTLQAGGSVTQSGVVNASGLTATLSAGSLGLGAQTNNIAQLNAVTAPAGITLTNGNNSLTVAGAQTTTNSAIAIDVGTGTYTQNTNIDLSAGSGGITVIADAVAIATNAGNNAFTTSGTLTLKPKTAGQAMSLAGAAAFDLSATEIAAMLTGASGPIVIGDAASSGTLTVGGAATFTGENLTLNAGAITDAGTATITATSLSLNANGQIGTDATNGIDVAATNLRVNTAGNANAFVRSGAVSLGTGASSVGSGILDLNATGTVTQAAGGAVTAGTLRVKTRSAGTANITLTNSANEATTVDLQARNVADTANAAGAISYTDATGFDVATINSTGNATLIAGNAITQSGAIAAATLTATTANAAGAAVTLTNAANAVTTVNLQARTGTSAAVGTVNSGAAIAYTDSNAVAVSGINTGTGPGGDVTLLTGGAITQSGAVKANTLAVTTASAAGAAITLTNTGNDATTVNLQVRDGTVAAIGANNANVAISYTDTSAAAFSGINSGAGAAGNVTLIAGGAITQTAAIKAATLTATTANASGAAITLTDTGNEATTVNLQGRSGTAAAVGAANSAGAVIEYTDATGFAVSGINTGTGAGGNVTLLAGGAVTQSGAIKAATLGVTTASAGGSAITLTTATNDVSTLNLQVRDGTVAAVGANNANAAVSYTDTSGYVISGIHNGAGAAGAVTLAAGAAVTQTGAVNASTLNATFTAGALNLGTQTNNIAQLNAVTAPGGFTLTNGNNSLVVAGNLTTTNAAVSIDVGTGGYTQNTNIDLSSGTGATTVIADTVAIGANTGNNAFTTSGTLTLKPKTAGQAMSLAGASAFDLSATEIAAILTGATGPIVIGDTASTGALTIGGAATFTGENLTLNAGTISDTGTQTITATSLTLNAAGQIGTDATNGIDVTAANLRVNTTGNANAFLRSGAINIGAGTSSVGTGTLNLRATGSVTQSGAITAGTLQVKTLSAGTASITLTNSANEATSVDLQARNAGDTANAAGALSFTDATGFDIAAASSTGNATFIAGDAITQTGAIAAATLSATTANAAGAAITLTNAANAVTTATLRARTGTAAAVGAANSGAAISYTDSNAIAFSGINTGTGAGGAVTLLAGGAITQSAAIKATTLSATTASAAGSAITLTNSANDATTVNLQARDGTVAAVGTNNMAVAVSYTDTSAVDFSGIHSGTGTGGAVTLIAGGAITQSGAIKATTLTATTANAAGANLTLDHTGNDAASVNLQARTGTAAAVGAANAAAGAISYTDASAISVTGINTGTGAGGNVSLLAGGAVTQTTAIKAATLAVTTASAGGSVITLTNTGNDATALNLQMRDGSVAAVGANNANVAASYIDTSGFDVTGIKNGAGAVGNVTLTAGGAVTQSGAIQAATLTATTASAAGVAMTLDHSGNSAATVNLQARTGTAAAVGAANQAASSISYMNAGALATSGINTGTGAGGNVTLVAGGAVTQSAAVKAATLAVTTASGGGSAITLSNASNDASTVNFQVRDGASGAVGANNAPAAIAYTDSSGFTVSGINNGAGTAGGVTLIAGGAVSQTGAVQAATLNATLSTGALNLGTQSNNVAQLNAVTAPGGFALTNGNNGVIVAGNLTTTNSAVAIDVGTGGYTQNANIDVSAGAGGITLTADAVAIAVNAGNNALTTSGTLTIKPKSAAQAMSLAGAAGFDLTAAEITALLTGATGPIVIGDAASTGMLTVGGAAAFTGKTLTLNAGAMGDSGTNTVTAANLSLNANGQIGTDATNGIDVAVTNLAVNTTGNASAFVRSGSVNLGTGTSSVGSGTLDLNATGAVTQSAALTAGTLRVKTRSAGTADITLTSAGNNAGTIDLQARDVADTANAAGALRYTDADGMDIAALGTAGNATLVAAGAVTQSGAIVASGLSLSGAGASYTLQHTGNAVTTLAANTGAVSFQQAGALAVGTVGAVVGMTATGTVALETTGAASNLTLDNAVNSGAAGDAVVLKAGSSNAAGTATGGQIINNVGAAGIVAASGRYLAYSGDPGTTTEGTTGYAKRYNTDATFVPAGSTSTFLYRVAPTLTVTANNKSRVYGDANPTLDGSVSGLIDGDSAAGVGVGYSTTAVFNTPVASSPVAITPAVTNNENYTLVLNNGQLTITQRPLTVSATGQNKVYDGNATATVTLSDNRVAGDTLATSYTAAAFPDKTVGTGRTVSVTGIGVTGAAAPNYTFNTTATTSADITARPLTVSATGQNKVYDGNTAATVTLSDNRVAGDTLTASHTSATFADKNVATGKTISVGGIGISGADAGNYSVNTTATASADITARALLATATGQNKVYDGNTSATVGFGDNRVAGDVLTVNGTAAFTDKNVATGKTVNVTAIALTGTDAGNYSVNTTTATTADITARALTVAATGQNKVYDGNTAATVTLSDNRVAGDTLTASHTAANFIDKNAANGKTINVTGIAVTGADAGNYTFNTTATATADITARALLATATGQNKVYDGNTSATVSFGDNRVAGDVLTVNGTAAFTDKNVATGKTVNVTAIVLTGTDAGNYSVNTTATTAADITARPLTVAAAGQNKVYDGNTAATVTLSDNRVAGDTLTASHTAATFSDKNAATGKTVTVTGIGISGADAGNYSANTTATTSADITQRALTVAAAGQNKVYDGNTAATVTLSDNRVAGDTLAASHTAAAFTDKNVATGKTINVSGISVTGLDAGNYSFNTTAAATADITARALTVVAAGQNKVYDGNTAAVVTLSDNRVAGDALAASHTAANFSDKNVATGKTINVTGIAVTGVDAGNYTFNTTASATADITARPLTVSATGQNKAYDGTTAATVTLGDNRVAGDTLTASHATANFSDKNVAAGKTINVAGISLTGTDAGNYSFNTTAATTADITARALVATATGQNKVYDGNTSATVVFGDNRVAGDTLTVGGTAAFTNRNVGTAKTVNVTGIALTGTDAGNYSVNTTATTAADITARALTVAATGQNKVYDGTTAATVTLSDDRVAGDTLAASHTAANFSDKNVANGKTINVTGIAVTGTDAGNYTFNTTATASADITARPLTVAATGQNKVYDGTTAATVTLADNRVAGDTLTASHAAATFTDKNAATAKTINVTGIAVTGADAGNYTANSSATATADITARPLTVAASGQNKMYDGTTAATVTLADNRVAGDALTVAHGGASFADKNVATAKPVSVTGIAISGLDAANYTVNLTATASADITPRPLAVTATGQNKVYDATTSATVTLGDNRVAGDTLVLAYGSAQFGDKNAGLAKPVSVNGIAVTGADAGNYTANTTAMTTADIARAVITSVTGITAQDRDEDGSVTATLSTTGAVFNGRLPGDALGVAGAVGQFSDHWPAANKLVTISGIALGGADAGNYTLASTTATATATIFAVDPPAAPPPPAVALPPAPRPPAPGPIAAAPPDIAPLPPAPPAVEPPAVTPPAVMPPAVTPPAAAPAASPVSIALAAQQHQAARSRTRAPQLCDFWRGGPLTLDQLRAAVLRDRQLARQAEAGGREAGGSDQCE